MIYSSNGFSNNRKTSLKLPLHIFLLSGLAELCEPTILNIHPEKKTEIVEAMLNFQHAVTGEFLRKVGPKMGIKNTKDVYPLKQFWAKDYKDLVRAEAELWVKVWYCLMELYRSNGGSYHPDIVEVFLWIIGEKKLVMLIFSTVDFLDVPTTKDVLRGYQKENTDLKTSDEPKLEKYKNPFKKDECFYTFDFIESMSKQAYKCPLINKKFYIPMIKARMILRDLIESSKPARILLNPVSGKGEHYTKRPRKKISPSKKDENKCKTMPKNLSSKGF